MSFSAAEADRRIACLVSVGTVTAVDGSSSRASVRVGDIETGLLPVTQLRMGGIRLFAMPSVGEQVMVFAPGGDYARAIVGPSIAAQNAPGDGDAAHAVLDMGSGELRVTGDLVVSGNITVTGRVTVGDDVLAAGVSLVRHTHTGVTSGNADTGQPKR